MKYKPKLKNPAVVKTTEVKKIQTLAELMQFRKQKLQQEKKLKEEAQKTVETKLTDTKEPEKKDKVDATAVKDITDEEIQTIKSNISKRRELLTKTIDDLKKVSDSTKATEVKKEDKVKEPIVKKEETKIEIPVVEKKEETKKELSDAEIQLKKDQDQENKLKQIRERIEANKVAENKSLSKMPVNTQTQDLQDKKKVAEEQLKKVSENINTAPKITIDQLEKDFEEISKGAGVNEKYKPLVKDAIKLHSLTANYSKESLKTSVENVVKSYPIVRHVTKFQNVLGNNGSQQKISDVSDLSLEQRASVLQDELSKM